MKIMKYLKLKAFTLSEVLITLVVIGVIASITLPVIIENHVKKETVTRFQKALSVANQALALSVIQNGPVEAWYSQSELGYNQYMEKY